MDDESDVVELNIEESNDLSFKVSVHGATQKPSAYRLICETDQMSFGFSGEADEEGNIAFTIPVMEKHLLPEQVYQCAIEVLVEGRFFRPVKFDVRFKQPLKCVVESIQVKSQKQPLPISVVAERNQLSDAKPKAPASEETFRITTVKEDVSKKLSLREKVSQKRTSTGIDDKTMEEIAKSTMERLSRITAKDSGGTPRK